MITVNNYIVEYDETLGAYKIQSAEAPVCPVCGQLLSGYDRRARHIIDSLGNVHWFSLRRLRCNNCKKLHLELPDFMRPNKHYEAQLIKDVLAGRSDFCPADDSTIRRWRSK